MDSLVNINVMMNIVYLNGHAYVLFNAFLPMFLLVT
jgi:hypothetical protein